MARVPDTYLQARNDEILAAAAECFARSGYRGTSMSDIAKEAGLSVGGLYRYFSSKDLLFHALVQNSSNVAKETWAVPDNSSEASAQLRSLVVSQLDMAASPKCRSGISLDIRLHGEALDSEIVRSEIEKAYSDRLEVITKLLAAAKGSESKKRNVANRRGRSITVQTKAQGRVLISLLSGAAVQLLTISNFDMKNYKKVLLDMIDTWLMK